MRVDGAPTPGPGPLLFHFRHLSYGSHAGTRVARRRVQPLCRRLGSAPPARPRPGPGLRALQPVPRLVHPPLLRAEAPACSRGTDWALRPTAVAGVLPPRPSTRSASPGRHLLNPPSPGRSRPAGPGGVGRVGQKLPRPLATGPTSPASPAGSRDQTPALAADPESPPALAPVGKSRAVQRPVRAPRRPAPAEAALRAPDRSRFLEEPPAAAGRPREGAPAPAGRARGAAAFPFSSQRKCFGRQIIPGDMKLLRPPHVARKKNHNEHLWRVLGIPPVRPNRALPPSFLGRGHFLA